MMERRSCSSKHQVQMRPADRTTYAETLLLGKVLAFLINLFSLSRLCLEGMIDLIPEVPEIKVVGTKNSPVVSVKHSELYVLVRDGVVLNQMLPGHHTTRDSWLWAMLIFPRNAIPGGRQG